MTRTGVSIVEILVVSVLSVVVLGTILGLWSGGTKMNKAAQSSVTLQNALLLEETIYQDFHQMGVDPTSWNTHMVAENCLSFYKVAFDGQVIKLRPVKYTRVASPGGLYFLKRTEVGGGKTTTKTFSNAPLLDVKFGQHEDTVFKRRYLTCYLWVAEEDKRRPGSQLTVNQDRPGCRAMIARIPMPSMLGNPAMAEVTKIAPDGSSLLPLDP